MSAEGIPCSSGYGPLNKASYIRDTLRLRGYTRVYGKAEIERWDERNRCPENDKLCEEAVWFTQNMLLGPRTDMDQIVEAVRKIRASASQLAKT
jgi:hypothetical protein